jgi:hypothetical protein
VDQAHRRQYLRDEILPSDNTVNEQTDSMNNALDSTPEPNQPEIKRSPVFNLLNAVLLLLILVTGAFFRYIGIQWGEFQYLHPDERFLVWVGTDIQQSLHQRHWAPPTSVNNFAVKPVHLPDCQNGVVILMLPAHRSTRTTAAIHFTLRHPAHVRAPPGGSIYSHSGFNRMTIGGVLSALVDLGCVLVYAIASRLFNRKIGLLAAAFSAFTVLDIQQSHFFTMDTFASFFTLLAVYLAVRVSLVGRDTKLVPPEPDAALDPPVDQPVEGVPAG